MKRYLLSVHHAWRRVHVLIVRSSTVAVVLLTAGCSYWGRRPLDQPTPVKESNPVWIWSRGAVHKWHAVVITQDLVSGIPFELPLECEHDVHHPNCRRGIPRAQVDSMKLGYRTIPEVVTRDAGFVTAFFLAWAGVCYLAGSPKEC